VVEEGATAARLVRAALFERCARGGRAAPPAAALRDACAVAWRSAAPPPCVHLAHGTAALDGAARHSHARGRRATALRFATWRAAAGAPATSAR
jgi:hypothetical protein